MSFVNLHVMDRVAAALTEAGVVTWNIEYRRSDDAGGGWPGTFLDVGRAADYLRELAPNHPLDLEKVITVGHSSGGHLALWLAARHRIGEDSDLFVSDPRMVQGAACLGGVPDLKRILPRVKAACRGVNAVELLLGGLPETVPDRYQNASPVELIPLGVHQLVICGVDDLGVPPADGIAYQEAAEAVGDRVEVLSVADAGHFELIAPWWSGWDGIEKAILSLLD
jgi:acetyl esterase/lipase